MKLVVSRDSVCAGDDADAPHVCDLSLPDDATLEDMARAVQQARFLPGIQGGKATWSVVSDVPLAVVAEQWSSPRMVCPEAAEERPDVSEGVVHLHVNYHAQMDPETVLEVLSNLRLKQRKRE